jgi:hypothetical protein
LTGFSETAASRIAPLGELTEDACQLNRSMQHYLIS